MIMNNSDKIKIELAISIIKKEMAKNNINISSINTALRQIGAVIDELPQNETCNICGFEKVSFCQECHV